MKKIIILSLSICMLMCGCSANGKAIGKLRKTLGNKETKEWVKIVDTYVESCNEYVTIGLKLDEDKMNSLIKSLELVGGSAKEDIKEAKRKYDRKKESYEQWYYWNGEDSVMNNPNWHTYKTDTIEAYELQATLDEYNRHIQNSADLINEFENNKDYIFVIDNLEEYRKAISDLKRDKGYIVVKDIYIVTDHEGNKITLKDAVASYDYVFDWYESLNKLLNLGKTKEKIDFGQICDRYWSMHEFY